MTKYKRWILLLTALTVFVVHTESLKATSLIHAGKFSKLLNTTTSTTSTSTTGEPPQDHLQETLGEMPDNDDDERFVEVNGTRIALTGIPQIDYVWDPNLPRELNGFNLSTYPFIDSMPAEEDIGFDCEDKINGFYASIKFGCQIYHHCLYGVRSDFICANFTAFDQKTFICHFASEVDCKNSYKYWNRNDDLYKATTEKATPSSGVAPLFDRNLYKRPAPGSQTLNTSPKNNQPLQPLITKDTFKPEPPPAQHPPARGVIGDADYVAPAVQRPARPLRRPYRRRRPQIDYYYYDDEEYDDDFYDDRGRRRQQRPRNRRPIYDDYRDTRRPLNDDDFDDYEYDRRPYRSRNRSESRRTGDDRRKQEDRRFDDRRRPYSDDRKPIDDRRRPEDERRSYDDRRYPEDRRVVDDRKRFDEERGQSDDRKYIRRKNPIEDPNDDKRRAPDRHESDKRQTAEEPAAADDKLVKPLGSIFDRARPTPKIARPVPLNEKNKFAYAHSDKPAIVEDEKKDKDEEYYEEYEDVQVSSSTTTTTTTTTVKPTTTSTAKPTTTTTKYSPRLKTLTTPLLRKSSSTSTLAPDTEYYEEEYYDSTAKPIEIPTPPKLSDRANLFNARRNALENLTQPPSANPTATPQLTASVPDNFRLNRFKSPSAKLINETAIKDNALKASAAIIEETSTTSRKPLPSISYNSKKFANQQTVFDPTTTETPKTSTTESIAHIINPRFNSRNTDPVELDPPTDEKDQKFVMRVIKRPFLPSRGGNPYKGRGLQPVGPASVQQPEQPQGFELPLFTSQGSELSAFSNEGSQSNVEQETALNNFNEPQQQNPLRTTLDDIYNEEYDVELNDALNPMLKPLTSSRGISGFSFSSLPNADKDGYRAQSQKSIQKTEAPKTSTTSTTSTESPQYEYEEVEYDY